MSRVSQKSSLSPSATRGSNAIDLGKDSGVDMGRKAQPSVTSGGIGITQEVTSVGGVSVSGGVSVDITPVDFGISVNEGTVSIATGAEIPGGLLGVSGGIEIDTNTGQVVGGSLGGEIGGFGVNVSNSQKGGLGVEITVQIPGTPITLSLGFGSEKKPKLTPAPTPSSLEKPILPIGDPRKYCTVVIAIHSETVMYNPDLTFYQRYTSIGSGSYNPATNYFTSKQEYIIKSGDNPPEVSIGSDSGGANWGESGTINVFNSGLVLGGLAGPESEIYKRLDAAYIDEKIEGSFFITTTRKRTYTIVYSDCSVPASNSSDPTNPFSPPSFSPFPNPPPRRQTKMDVCCRENLALLREIYKKLGLARFPGKLPATIVQEISKEGEEPAEPPQVPIPDLVTLLNWQFERDDERWGQWEVQIDIKDADITKEGDQKKTIRLPNLAESIAEFEGQLLSIMTNVDALVALQVKNLAESGMARQEAIKGYLASKAIIKYMAFKATETDVPVPMTFTAGAETISALLEESEGHIKGTDYVEKETLRDVYLDLLQAAAIIRAVHWQKIDTKTDTKSQLLNILRGSVDLAASIANPQNLNGDGGEKTFNPENNFEDFIDSVEDGFRKTTGITDIQNPYGKTPDRRPRIRQIGDNISQAGGNN
jgi:hypothetical protein